MGGIHFTTEDYRIEEIKIAFSCSSIIHEIASEGYENNIFIRGGVSERANHFDVMTSNENIQRLQGVRTLDILASLRRKYAFSIKISGGTGGETVIYIRKDARERNMVDVIKTCKILVCLFENKIKRGE